MFNPIPLLAAAEAAPARVRGGGGGRGRKVRRNGVDDSAGRLSNTSVVVGGMLEGRNPWKQITSSKHTQPFSLVLIYSQSGFLIINSLFYIHL